MFSTLSSVVSACPTGLSTVFAYLDPGSGSMILQVLIAGLLSSMFFVKSTFVQFRGWLVGRRAER